MAKFKMTLQELRKGKTFAAGESHILTIVGTVTRLRLFGLHFETDKTFLLPGAMPGIRKLKKIYDEHPNFKVLVSGHTDTVGKADYNVHLSEERAKAMAAFLTDKVEEWTKYYSGRHNSDPWGTREDQYMLATLEDDQGPFYTDEVDGISGPNTQSAIKRFQTSAGLKVDGIIGPKTREALVKQYMAQDGTSLPEGTEMQTHGCGFFHPAVETPPDTENEENRRVEVYLFQEAIEPSPQSPCPDGGCAQYEQWQKRVGHNIDVGTGVETAAALRLRVHANPDDVIHLDDKFRLFSADGFEQIVELPDDAEEDAEFVDVFFKDVPVEGTYSLEVICPDNDNYLILEEVSFEEMEESDNSDEDADQGDPLELEPEDPA